MKKPSVYLDGAANTPISKTVVDAMKPFLKPGYVGNSKSVHSYGIIADRAIEETRESIAAILGTDVKETLFTSGATEGNNWAIKMTVLPFLTSGQPVHIICGALEHDSVLNSCKQMESFGCHVDYVLPKYGARYTAKDIKPYIRSETKLICITAVNNELGIRNDAESIIKEAQRHKIKTLIDCTQLVGYGGKSLRIGELFKKATFMTFSAHKIYGPTGVGCFICRDPDILPLICAGSQEFGKRGGTSNTAGIVGMGAAIKELSEIGDLGDQYSKLYSYLMSSLKLELPEIKCNVRPDHSNIISLNCSAYCSYEKLATILAWDGFAVSGGSACTEEVDETKGGFNGSHVLLGIGLSEPEIRNTIRVSFIKTTTTKDIDMLVNELKEARNVFNYEN